MDMPLDDGVCYNLQGALSKIEGLQVDEDVTLPVLRRLFLEGGFMEHALESELYVIINKAELDKPMAEAFARHLFHPDVKGIAITSAMEGWIFPVDNSHRRIDAVVLAAGSCSRFGGNKLLETIDGRILLNKVLDNVLASFPDEPYLVVGDEGERFMEVITDPSVVHLVHNPDHCTGMASSLKAGLHVAEEADAILVILADMPRVDAQLITTVINAYRDSCAWALRPVWEGKPGHPVVLGKELFKDLETLDGDKGARDVLSKYSEWVLTFEVPPDTQVDIDTKEDMARHIKGE